VSELTWLSDTVKVAAVVPVDPSVTDTSLIEIVGSAPAARANEPA
jgi:hypothetical protein